MTGKLKGVPERAGLRSRAPQGPAQPAAVAADEWGGWVWVNLAGPEHAPSLESTGSASEIIDRSRPVQDGGHGRCSTCSSGTCRSATRRSSTASTRSTTPPSCTASTRSGRSRPATQSSDIVNDHNYMCFVPRYQHRDKLGRGLGPSPVGDLPLRRVPQHGLQLQPRAHPGVQPDPDRRRPHPVPVLGDRLPGRRATTPSTTTTGSRMQDHWEHLKVVVGEDIDIYQQLAAHEALERLPRATSCRRGSARSPTTTRRWRRMISSER